MIPQGGLQMTQQSEEAAPFQIPSHYTIVVWVNYVASEWKHSKQKNIFKLKLIAMVYLNI